MGLRQPEATMALITDAIEKAKNRTKTQRLKSWVQTELRSGLGITINKKRTGVAVATKVTTGLLSLLKIIPIVGSPLSEGAKAGVKYGANKLQQKLADDFIKTKVKEWSGANVDTHDLAQFMQDILNQSDGEIFSKLVNAVYKIHKARKEVLEKAAELNELVAKFPDKLDKIGASLEELAYAYGYYKHRFNQLQLYTGFIYAYIFQVQGAIEIYDLDINRLDGQVAQTIDSVLDDFLINR